MSRKAESITLSVRDWEKAKLQALAAEWGQTWGEKPNISKLIKAIAQGTLRIAPNHNWSDDRINSLNLARNLLIDQGRRDDALVLAQLLLERSEPNHPLRQEIQAFVDRPVLTQRLELERYCQQQQPFRLTYGDAADRLWHFTVRHGRIMPQDDRDYLFCWCEETAGNQDLPALSHNWCLRLDRILPEANLSPMTGPWRGDLDTLEVELLLQGSLAFRYRSKGNQDLSVVWDEHQPIKRVIRRTHSLFWLFREVRAYGLDCYIGGPSLVRDRFVAETRSLLAQYESTEVEI